MPGWNKVIYIMISSFSSSRSTTRIVNLFPSCKILCCNGRWLTFHARTITVNLVIDTLIVCGGSLQSGQLCKGSFQTDFPHSGSVYFKHKKME